MIGRDAIGESVRAAGIFGNVAANGAGLLARGIRSKIETIRPGGECEIEIDDTRLDDRALIFGIEFKNAVHARENNHDTACSGERAAGKAGACAAANNGDVVLCGELYDLRDLSRGGREDNDIRAPFFNRAVVLVEKNILRLKEDGGRAEKLFQFANES